MGCLVHWLVFLLELPTVVRCGYDLFATNPEAGSVWDTWYIYWLSRQRRCVRSCIDGKQNVSSSVGLISTRYNEIRRSSKSWTRARLGRNRTVNWLCILAAGQGNTENTLSGAECREHSSSGKSERWTCECDVCQPRKQTVMSRGRRGGGEENGPDQTRTVDGGCWMDTVMVTVKRWRPRPSVHVCCV